MTKKEYKQVAERLYKTDIEEYIKLYDSVRNLANFGLLDRDWLNFIYHFDEVLFASA